MLKFLLVIASGVGGAFLAAEMSAQCFHGLEAQACGGEPSFGIYALGFFAGLIFAAVAMTVIKVFDAR
jgi:hypothetical protein